MQSIEEKINYRSGAQCAPFLFSNLYIIHILYYLLFLGGSMFILRKNHITLLIACLIISFTFCLIKNDNSNKTFDIKQVSALPIDEKVIIIDAGHRTEKTEEL